jgi:hypothetical protein
MVMLSLGSSKLAFRDEIKDLDIVIGNTVGFFSYTSIIVSRVFARSNLIYKCVTSKDVVTLVRAFLMNVRPLLEYAFLLYLLLPA